MLDLISHRHEKKNRIIIVSKIFSYHFRLVTQIKIQLNPDNVVVIRRIYFARVNKIIRADNLSFYYILSLRKVEVFQATFLQALLNPLCNRKPDFPLAQAYQ